MTNPSSYGGRRYLAVWTFLLAVLMTVTPLAAAEGPWIDVASPEDGGHVTTTTVTVSGTVTEPVHTLALSGEDLVHAELVNTRWVNGNVVYRPVQVFGDQFGGVLDPAKWTIVKDPQNVTVETGVLKIDYLWQWPAPTSNGTMVKSKAFDVPEGVDYQATYRMKAGYYGYSGAGGGVSDGSTNVWESHLSTLSFWSGGAPASWLHVIADGTTLYNSTTYDIDWHDYTTAYDAGTDTFTCYRDADALGMYRMDTSPSIFWFGHTEETGMYDARSVIEVDSVDLWATSGHWTSDVIDMDHHTVLQGSDLYWSSSNRNDADVVLSVRSSTDEVDWTDWVAFDGDGNLPYAVNGTYYQLRMDLAIPDVLKTSAHITVSGIDLRYIDPVTSVEVRSEQTEWVPTEGTYEWQADLQLVENENTVYVRATDTSGAVNETSIDLVVDTTPPVGTMSIAGEETHVNDLNVTLLLNATDRYGVEWMDISHYPDFSRKVRLPYSGTAEWRMSEILGDTFVYVRFVDAHGLLSPVLSDSIFYDPVGPDAKLAIDGGAKYTGTQEVRLNLEYSDNVEVVTVELANDPGFTDPYIVPGGETVIEDWMLAGASDGTWSVHMRVTDEAGNVATATDDIELFNPTQLGSVVIEDGTDITGGTVVYLTISWPDLAGIRDMQVSNDPTFEGAERDEPREGIMWILPDGDGEKTVYVRFTDYHDLFTLPVSDSIYLDQTPPVVNVSLDDGALYTTDTSVQGRVSVDDASPPLHIWYGLDDDFEGDRPLEFAETFDITIPARESDHRVFVMVEDAAGNLGMGSDMIHYATIRPHITLDLPGGDVVQTSPTIAVEVTPVDPYGDIHLQYAFDAVPDEDGPWTPLTGLVRVAVDQGAQDGVHTIWVRARNAAGLTSEAAVSIDVTLDNVAPSLSIDHPLDGARVTKVHQRVHLEVTVSDTSKLRSLVYAVDGGAPQNLSVKMPRANVTLDQWGEHTIEVVAEDVAGNVATSTTSFRLQDADAMSTGTGTGLLLIVVLALLGAALAVAYTYNRRYMPGLRPASIEEGDGWHEDWDHPGIAECDDERRPCELKVHPEDPVYLEARRRKEGKDVTPSVQDLSGTELEPVEMPGESAPEAAPDPASEWDEF